MIAKLWSALNYASETFENEVFGIAQNISLDSRTIYHGKKSEVLWCIEACNEYNSLQNTFIHSFQHRRLYEI